MIDPICLLHGKRRSQHVCLYCCLCFKDLTPADCDNGEDVCRECAIAERSPRREPR